MSAVTRYPSSSNFSWPLATLVCGLAALFYLYEFALQVSPAVITSELMRDFHITTAGLGTMSAFFYYAYMPMQLLGGLLYDRFGPRRVLSIAIFVCACGALLFGVSQNLATASIGRFFIGLGAAFSFTGTLLLVSRWFPARYFALLAGVVQLMSSLGAIGGQVPLAAAVDDFGWRNCILLIGIIGILLALLVRLVVKDHPPWLIRPKQKIKKTRVLVHLMKVMSKPQNWWVSLYAFCIWGPVVIFAALWGVPFLQRVYHVNTSVAASAIAMIWLGIGMGSPFIGWWSDYMGRRLLPLVLVALMGIVVSSLVIYMANIPFFLMYILLFILGLSSSGQALSFGLVKDNNKPNVVGTAIGFNNMTVVAGGALFQPLVGILIHHGWNGVSVGGLPVYTLSDYRDALFLVPLCYIVAFLLCSCCLRETHCKAVYKIEKQGAIND